MASLDESARVQLQALGDFIRGTPRPVYFTGAAPLGFAIEEGGLHLKVRKDAAPGRVFFRLSPKTMAFFDRAEDEPLRDTWSVLRRDQLRRRLLQLLTIMQMSAPDSYVKDGLAAWSQRYEATTPGMLIGFRVALGPGL